MKNIINDTLYITTQLSVNLQPITGGNPTIVIKKSDGYYYDGSEWVTTPNSLSMIEYDDTNYPGLYVYSLVPDEITTITAMISYTYKNKLRCESQIFEIVSDDIEHIDSRFNTVDASLSQISTKLNNISASGVPMHGEVIIDNFKNFIKIKQF